MELNRKELKKIMYDFSVIASRMMRVQYDEYNLVLRKFLAFIEDSDIIIEYINSGYDDEYNAEEDYIKVKEPNGYTFDFGPTSVKESYQIYTFLKYFSENIKGPEYALLTIYGKKHWQDNIKEFNDRVVLVLINNIEAYMTKVGIDMGFDENLTFNVSGGQVNIANENATINATQNNGVNADELNAIIGSIMANLEGLSSNDKETLMDSIEMIQDEITKAEPKGKIISNGIKLIAQIMAIANGLPILVGNIQRFIDFVTPYIR